MVLNFTSSDFDFRTLLHLNQNRGAMPAIQILRLHKDEPDVIYLPSETQIAVVEHLRLSALSDGSQDVLRADLIP